MRILAAIPHYFDPTVGKAGDGRSHGSTARDPRPRIEALSRCLAALQQHFGPAQCVIDIASRSTRNVNAATDRRVDVVVCTAGDRHLLGNLASMDLPFSHRMTRSEPMLLGFECREVLRENIGSYDFYCFLEDDLIIGDPWFFAKLRWFNGHLGDDVLLQPNRFEIGRQGPILKAYVDGDIRADVTARYQNIQEIPSLRSPVLGLDTRFVRPLNPHSGCYFLNARQLEKWAKRGDFSDRDVSFVGPLESAATLGIMKAFRVYKPAPENASFLEIEHAGTGFLGLIKRPEDLGKPKIESAGESLA